MLKIEMKNHIDQEPLKSEDFVRRVQALDDNQQGQFARAVELVLLCYEKSDKYSALILHTDNEGALEFVPINADMQDITEMLEAATEVADAINTDGAPAKEMFN